MTLDDYHERLVQQAKRLLESKGYVVLKEKSYRQAQERQRVADALRREAEKRYLHLFDWMDKQILPRERYMTDRCTFLYGVARAHGATVEELSGPTTTSVQRGT